MKATVEELEKGMAMRLKVYCVLTVLFIATSCKKDEQPTQPIGPTPPQVHIISPLNNSSIGAGLVPVLVEATDDKGVAKVEVYVDSHLDTTLAVPPYRYLWNTGSYSDSSRHAIFAKAYDTDNNVTGSEVVMTTVFTLRPSNLQVTTATDTSVTLQWSDNSRVETGYEIEQSENNGPYTRVKQVPPNTATTTIADTFYVGTTYRFRARAVQDSTVSGYSNEALVTLQLAPTILSATFMADTAVTLTWQDNSTFETGFEIELGIGGTNFRLVTTLGANTTTATVVDTFLAGISYSFRIRAKSRYNISNYSTIQRSFTFLSPSNLTMLPVSRTEVRLNWLDNSSFELRFVLERAENTGQFVTLATLPVDTVTYSNTSLDTSRTFSYRVRAESRYNSSSFSNTISIRYFPYYENIRSMTANGGVSSVAFSPDGSLVVGGSSDNNIKLWRVSNASLFRTLAGHTNSVRSVAFSPDGDTIASGSADNSIKLWRVSDGSLLRTLTGHIGTVFSVAFSPDGNTVAGGSEDGSIKFWRVSDGSLLRTLTGHTSTVFQVAFSPDGNTIVSVDGSIKLWRVSDGFLLRTLTGHTSYIFSATFSPDGNMIASGSDDNTVKLWLVNGGNLLRTLTAPSSVSSVAFSLDGNTVAGGGSDNTPLQLGSIKHWLVGDGTVLRTLTGHTGSVRSVAFSPDGNTFASGSADNTVRLWQSTGSRWQIIP